MILSEEKKTEKEIMCLEIQSEGDKRNEKKKKIKIKGTLKACQDESITLNVSRELREGHDTVGHRL